MRKLRAALIAGGLLVGTALGQQPAPAPVVPPRPAPAPSPVNPPMPAPMPGSITYDIPATVPPYGFAKCRAAGAFKGAGWIVVPDRTTNATVVMSSQSPVFPAQSGGQTVSVSVYEFSGPPGRYDVYNFAGSATGDITTYQGSVVFEAVAPVIPPVPGPIPVPPLPGPNPQPAPTPVNPPKPFPSTQRQAFPQTSIERGGVARG